MRLEFYRQMFEEYSEIKFHENPSSESRVVPCGLADGQTDTHMAKQTVAFSNYAFAGGK